MSDIDITMTAVLRPKLLKETLAKIKRHVCSDDTSNYRLIINIDPVGENVDPMNSVKLANKYFSNIIYNIPDKPSFPKAVKWVWSQSTAPYVFHWEDDVNILRDINVSNMINILKKYKELSSLRLFKQKCDNRKVMTVFRCKWRYHDEGFYLADDWRYQFGLNPILIKHAFVKEASQKLRDDINPEKQFRVYQKNMRGLIKKWKYGIYAKPGENRMIDGRKGQNWKNIMRIDKPKGQPLLFIEWVGK